jgi:hypothetical protein
MATFSSVQVERNFMNGVRNTFYLKLFVSLPHDYPVVAIDFRFITSCSKRAESVSGERNWEELKMRHRQMMGESINNTQFVPDYLAFNFIRCPLMSTVDHSFSHSFPSQIQDAERDALFSHSFSDIPQLRTRISRIHHPWPSPDRASSSQYALALKRSTIHLTCIYNQRAPTLALLAQIWVVAQRRTTCVYATTRNISQAPVLAFCNTAVGQISQPPTGSPKPLVSPSYVPYKFPAADPEVTICYDQGVTLSIPGLPSSTVAVATAASVQSSTAVAAPASVQSSTTGSQAAAGGPTASIKSNDAGAPASPTAQQTVVDSPTTTSILSNNDTPSSRVNILAGIAALALTACLL